MCVGWLCVDVLDVVLNDAGYKVADHYKIAAVCVIERGLGQLGRLVVAPRMIGVADYEKGCCFGDFD